MVPSPLLLFLLPTILASLPSSPASLPSISINSRPSSSLLASLGSQGVLVVRDLGPGYTWALQSLRRAAPSCLEESLRVTMEDGSERFTTARDSTVSHKQAFPPCVLEEVEVITAAFDRVDKLFSSLLRAKFGQQLDVVEQEGNKTRHWEKIDSKTHLHVYKQTAITTSSLMTLPYHTDNGLYVLLTPSPLLPLRVLTPGGAVASLNTDDSSVLLLLGTGLTSWLLPHASLHAAPHGLPALHTALSPAPRTVLARMRVAPTFSRPATAPGAPTFWSHFSAPLDHEEDATRTRLRKQRSAGCSQDWPHACSHGCSLPGTSLPWHNGDPIKEIQNVASSGECRASCRDTSGCVAWTLNTSNGWCGLKGEDQIQPKVQDGFESGLMDAGSQHCRQPRGRREAGVGDTCQV